MPDANHPPSPPSADFEPARLEQLLHQIEHAVHLLPTQGPITVFVHHNTLHSLEESPFEQAIGMGEEIYGAQPFLSESRYRREFSEGRIRQEDLTEVLLEDLKDHADELIGGQVSRYRLRQAMLLYDFGQGSDAELRWRIAETDALSRFRDELSAHTKERIVSETRFAAARERATREENSNRRLQDLTSGLIAQLGGGLLDNWSDEKWTAFTLNLLWRVCRDGVHGIPCDPQHGMPAHEKLSRGTIRHVELMHQVTGIDIDRQVDELLIRFCAAYLDQGYANWLLPERETGFYQSFFRLYGHGSHIHRWWKKLSSELRRLEKLGLQPIESIDESLRLLGITKAETEEYLTRTLLALRGWAGMIWQMETNAEWTPHPAPAGSLLGYLAVRLILERLALQQVAKEMGEFSDDLTDLRRQLRHRISHPPRVSVDRRAYTVFQLAQLLGIGPISLLNMTREDWTQIVREIEAFSEFERRKIFHLAYERHYRNQFLDAVCNHADRLRQAGKDTDNGEDVSFQVVTCIDDREESFRRHLEEVDPRCETFGAPGFYAVAMYYRGASDAHFRPLCPVIIKPNHYVREEVAYSLQASSRQRADTRRVLGKASHHWHIGSRSFIGGIVTGLLGSVASVPLVARVLFPRLTARLRDTFGSLLRPPPVTELRLLRQSDPPGPEDDHLGYSLAEMVNSVERVLRDIGLTKKFSRMILVVGHGSRSLNNPHESAYCCGACSGGWGGANARSFAQMANDLRVRSQLRDRGVDIPDSTFFIGAVHDTCDEDVTYFDLDRLPIGHRRLFESCRDSIDQARERNAQERCRRFESADLDLTPAEALAHVEERAEDLSQARPEYNHATNALCIVGRRDWTRGLFLDRRAFLQSYDPAQDTPDHAILARILQPAVPVCAGISLEYYFSCVDVIEYGCGSKLPHNITSMLGVMEGAASDLRPGLSQQMIEIHEPLRILFLVESTPDALLSIMARNAEIDRMVKNRWVQLATYDAQTNSIKVFRDGSFVPYEPGSHSLPVVNSSADWFRGWRDHLGFTSIVAHGEVTRGDGNGKFNGRHPFHATVTARKESQ